MKNTFSILILAILLFGCKNNENDNTPNNGDLNNTFIEKKSDLELTPEEKYQQEKEKLIAAGWEEQEIQNGQLPSCYNFKPKKGNAVLFYNLLEDGNGDDLALHAALPAIEGEKWLANFWVWDPKRI